PAAVAGLQGRNSARTLGIRASSAGVARASIPAEILAYARAAYPPLAVCAPAPVTHLPGSASGACFAGSHSPWPLPFAPPAPRRSRPLCSSASQLLWQSLTSRDRASSATAPRLPDADRRQLPNGRSRDLPVPAQGASAHARFFDHAGPFGPCDGASETCCLPRSKRRQHPGIGFIAVGMVIADHPPHRSEHALLTHSAPTSNM